MTKKELEDYLWGAANIMRGHIDAADFKQYIFPFLFFKRISDVWDEELAQAKAEFVEENSEKEFDFIDFQEYHRFQIPENCHWQDVLALTEDVGKALKNALEGIERANQGWFQDIFGDAQWTNKKRLDDEKLLDLLNHFNEMNLSVANVPHDVMGDGYEYLIKKFADDSGHTAAEFYTNRTVVKLMTRITDPQPKENIYDPTCGSGGILLNSIVYLKEQGKEYRNVGLFGQELNLITSAIARINMFLHDIDDFEIVQGDTLKKPEFTDLITGELRRFDIVMANPPYSVKRWNQGAWLKDPYGRNMWGTPPQGCADYAFQQHIMQSLDPETGRCVVLWPHGVLFRDSETELRRKMIEGDFVDAVIGLGKNLFYNSSMESCLLVCRMKKTKERRGKILFINAVNEIKLERSEAYLKPENIERITQTYRAFEDVEGFAKVVTNADVLENNANLSIQLYVKKAADTEGIALSQILSEVQQGQADINTALDDLFVTLNNFGISV